jgi:hypothetical protein
VLLVDFLILLKTLFSDTSAGKTAKRIFVKILVVIY